MNEKKILNLQEKLAKAYRSYNLAEVARLQGEINRLEKTTVTAPMNNILERVDEKKRTEVLNTMHKMFILSDLLYGVAIDFENAIRKIDSSITTVHVVRKAKSAADDLRSITREIDTLKDDYLSETFGDMADETDIILTNVINKYRNRQNKNV